MSAFALDSAICAAQCERAALRGASGEGPDLAAKLRAGEALGDQDLVALFLASDVDTKELLDIAQELHSTGASRIETFAPLYISNECDGECLMCGMRSFNDGLRRETAGEPAIREQLDILHRRGLRGVAILTGEYRHGSQRREMLARTASAVRDATNRGFAHVLINVGSLEREEYQELAAIVPLAEEGAGRPRITMCTFQEAYDRPAYERFMGRTPDNPRTDFTRRLENFDRAADAGMRSVNPGLLLGLNPDLAYELLALAAHVRHLLARGMAVYVSLPRLRKASGAAHHAGVSDEELTRLVSLLSAGFPKAKVVISTREAPQIQRLLLPVIGVLTAGSPGVAPYTETGAHFEIEASQFEVADQRPFEDILAECLEAGATIDGYEPDNQASAVSNQ
jgi:2-iminoacetate synthase